MGLDSDPPSLSGAKNEQLGSLLRFGYKIPAVYPRCPSCTAIDTDTIRNLGKGLEKPEIIITCKPDFSVRMFGVGIIRHLPLRRIVSVQGFNGFEGTRLSVERPLSNYIECPVESSD
jgi:hypothetical protein